MAYYFAVETTESAFEALNIKKSETFKKLADTKNTYECTLEEIEDFIALSEKYGVDFYAGLPWESFPAESFMEIAKALYEKGAKKLIDWNANHVAKKLHDLQGVKVCGDKEKLYSENAIEPKKIVRITNFNGYDISVIDVNWKG